MRYHVSILAIISSISCGGSGSGGSPRQKTGAVVLQGNGPSSASGGETSDPTTRDAPVATDDFEESKQNTGEKPGFKMSEVKVSLAPIVGQSVESCSNGGRSWIGAAPGGEGLFECGEMLVSWCCSQEEIKARFPARAVGLAAQFAELIDREKYKLYHCSSNELAPIGGLVTTLHFAKVVSGKVCYKTLTAENLKAESKGNQKACPALVTTIDLTISEPSCE